MPDLEIAAAPDLSADTSSVDTSTADTQDTFTETPAADTETETPSGETSEPGTETDSAAPPIVNGRLSAQMKATLDELKAKNPKQAQAIARALQVEDRLRREVPGGFQEVQQLRSKIEELGGDQGIEEVQAKLAGWDDFDNKYMAGDATILKFLTETPEAKDAFLKIAPAVFQEYLSLHPEGHDSYVCQVFEADMLANNIPLTIERLGDLIPADNPRAAELLKQLKAYVQNVRGLASKKIEAPKSAAAAPPDNRVKELESQVLQNKRNSWAADANSKHHTPVFNEAVKKQLGNRQFTEAQKASLLKYYKVNLQEVLASKKDYHQTLERFVSANQQDGFMKHYAAIYKDAVPLALRKTIAELGIGAKPGPKPAEAATPGAKGPIKPVGKPAAGFTFVSKKPDMATEVNRQMTSAAMWSQRQAVLRDGRRVTWK